jgi:lipopolysaccharide transport system ATP-binding protein
MLDSAISVEGLGKRYRLGGARAPYHTLRESLSQLVRRPTGRAETTGRRTGPGDADEIWALRDVTFDVPRGQVLGIIGRNGAGKSTLLKVLSRITEPTVGRATVRGRLGSLLEVGTGFHPELSGHENIYLNGAILGMSRADIQRRFDEIVAFAEVERFLTTPVKHYSSGMYMRLAFSVAAHLEPEVLVVDEVLAVGDAEFQRKCLGKMQAVAGEGRTVLFVSHNLDAVRSLCSRAILMSAGRVKMNDTVESVVAQYLNEFRRSSAETDLLTRGDRTGSGEIRMSALRFRDEHGNPTQTFKTGARATTSIELVRGDAATPTEVTVFLAIVSGLGVPLTLHSNLYTGETLEVPGGRASVECVVLRLPLQPGVYRLDLGVRIGDRVVDHITGAGHVQVEPGDYFGTGQQPPSLFPVLGDAAWSVRPLDEPAGRP